MEDILASIRRILSEEDLPADHPPEQLAPPPETNEPDVLILDSSMLVADPPPPLAEQPRPPLVARSALPPVPPVAAPLVPPAVMPPAVVPLAVVPPDVVNFDVMPEAVVSPPVAEPPPVEAAPIEETTSDYMPETPTWAGETPAEPDATPEFNVGSVDSYSEVTEDPAAAEPEPAFEMPFSISDPEAAPARLESVRTELPIAADALPPLTSSSVAAAEGSTAMPSEASAPRSPHIMTRLPTPPVLVPVPRSALGVPPPLLRRPVSVTRESTLVPATRPSSAPPLTSDEPQPTAAPAMSNQSESPPMSASMSLSPGLASVETTAAAAGSVTNLVRALTSDRGAQTHSGGPTIADLVREEIRPMLKDWLDSNLPPLVERLVRAEIERVIARASV
jgi:cell pole-organizing protein PopZ